MIPDFIKVARLLGLFLFLSSFGTSAHHSVALQFDMTADITIVGEIVEMEWRNPHSWLHVEVETEQGQVELWRVEFGSGSEELNDPGIPSRDGSRQMEGDEVLLSDGRTLFSGAGPSRE